jgi:ATP-binding cassette subfamily C (CFTR/MRP) protein 1
VRRLESASRTPIYGHFGETINGLSSIRAYAVEKQFIDEAHHRVDENIKASYASTAASM